MPGGAAPAHGHRARGGDAYEPVQRHVSKGRDLKFESVWLVEKGRAYVVTYTATPDAFAGTEPTAEAVIGSFELG